MYLPLFFKSGCPCLVVGGGRVASHKIGILLDAACRVVIVAPEITGFAAKAVHKHSVRWLERDYAAGDCEGYQLIIAATPSREVNRSVSEEARERGIPVNVVDDPELSTVIFPAIWRERSLSIAVSTGGVAPFMAAEIRSRLGRYARGLGDWVETGARFRETVKKSVQGAENRNSLYRKFLRTVRPGNHGAPPDSFLLDDWTEWMGKIGKPDG
ncbi:MAG: bifunctional precorrin-2 dehydrogenase/sirohydrochlorin ferrochelatase [Acidobacteria bacterium]|nr:bifunctional precorrin-2 dehydrogenase/sirohydrochlorin ferrochelatase [Acidobacteriota bacterium]